MGFHASPHCLVCAYGARPAQIAATVGTTVHVEPEIMKQNAVITFDIQNAGIDTLRVAVPEAVANDVRFHMLTPSHTIQQRDKAAQAEDGWVTWTLVLQNETTGTVQLGVDWDVTVAKVADAAETPAPPAGTPEAALAAESAAKVLPEQTLVVEPPRVRGPFTDDQAQRRRVVLTQVRGEIRLLRHESLSITADSQGETTEAIDVRGLNSWHRKDTSRIATLPSRHRPQSAFANMKFTKLRQPWCRVERSKSSQNVRLWPRGVADFASRPVNVNGCESTSQLGATCRLRC